MSTVQEIESAIQQLPREQMRKIQTWLDEMLNQPRPEGYFASDYPLPEDRLKLEEAMAKIPQHPAR